MYYRCMVLLKINGKVKTMHTQSYPTLLRTLTRPTGQDCVL